MGTVGRHWDADLHARGISQSAAAVARARVPLSFTVKLQRIVRKRRSSLSRKGTKTGQQRKDVVLANFTPAWHTSFPDIELLYREEVTDDMPVLPLDSAEGTLGADRV